MVFVLCLSVGLFVGLIFFACVFYYVSLNLIVVGCS